MDLLKAIRNWFSPRTNVVEVAAVDWYETDGLYMRGVFAHPTWKKVKLGSHQQLFGATIELNASEDFRAGWLACLSGLEAWVQADKIDSTDEESGALLDITTIPTFYAEESVTSPDKEESVLVTH